MDTQATVTTITLLLTQEATRRSGTGTTKALVVEIKIKSTLDPVVLQDSTTTTTNRLPSSLFNKASPEEKKLIIQLQNKARGNYYNPSSQYPKGERNKKTGGTTNTGDATKDNKASTRKVNVTQQVPAQDTSNYSGIFSPARKMNFSKSKRDKTSTVTMEKNGTLKYHSHIQPTVTWHLKKSLGKLSLLLINQFTLNMETFYRIQP